ncbi:MAG: hypothetical protein ACOC3Z_01405 [Nanoarchaeota archaeon]
MEKLKLKPGKFYTKEVEDALESYLFDNTLTHNLKNKIFTNQIYPSLLILARNAVFKYDFMNTNNENRAKEVVTYVTERLHYLKINNKKTWLNYLMKIARSAMHKSYSTKFNEGFSNIDDIDFETISENKHEENDYLLGEMYDMFHAYLKECSEKKYEKKGVKRDLKNALTMLEERKEMFSIDLVYVILDQIKTDYAWKLVRSFFSDYLFKSFK